MERPKPLMQILADLVDDKPRTVTELRIAIRRLDRHHEKQQAELVRRLAHQRELAGTLRDMLRDRGVDDDAIENVLQPVRARQAQEDAEQAAKARGSAPVPSRSPLDHAAQEIEDRRIRGN